MKKSRNIMMILLAAALLSGCGKNNSSSSSSTGGGSGSTGSSGGGTVTGEVSIKITDTFNDTYRAVIDRAIGNLAEKYPDFKINVTHEKFSGGYSDLKDKVVKGIPVNDYPDLVVAYPDSVNDFIQGAAALDITSYMKHPIYGWSADDFNDVYEAYVKEGQMYTVEGTYSLPLAKSTEGMFYNADKIIGLNLSAYDATINGGKPLDVDYINNLTWDELFDHLCPAILKYNEANSSALIDTTTEAYWSVVGYDSDDNLFITLAEQYGYGYTSIDEFGNGSIDFVNDGMKELMKKFNAARKNHYISTRGYSGNYANTYSTANPQQCLFAIGSTGGTSHQFSTKNPMELNVAPIPHAPGKENKMISQGPSIAFLDHKDEKRALASWLLYKEITNTDNATNWTLTTSYMPIRQSVSESSEFIEATTLDGKPLKTLERLQAKAFTYAIDVSDFLFTSPVFKGSSDARTEVGKLLTSVLKENDLTDEKLNTLFETAKSNTLLKM